MNIVLFIGTLDAGGAERQFVYLARGLADKGHRVRLITLYPGGAFSKTVLEDRRIEYETLFDTRPRSKIVKALHLLRAAKKFRMRITSQPADVVYSGLYLLNLVAWYAARGTSAPLVWWLCATRLAFHPLYFLTFHWNRLLSRHVLLTIFESQPALEWHRQRGFRFSLVNIVPNGIDTDYFMPMPAQHDVMRERLSIPVDVTLIGMVARFDPIKNYPGFIRAAAYILAQDPKCWFICVGSGKPHRKKHFLKLCQSLGVSHRFVWLDHCAEMPALYSSLDACCLPSFSEGSPNVVVEAMACGVPCVVSDVGNSAQIVGELGWVASSYDPKVMGELLLAAVARGADLQYKTGLRRRIEENFSLQNFIDKTEAQLLRVMQ